MKNGVPGFGLRFEDEPQGLEVDLVRLGQAQSSYNIGDNISITTSLFVRENGEVVQSAEIRSMVDTSCTVSYVFDFGISVNRASYGQLTEGGPIPIPRSENRLTGSDVCSGLLIRNEHLGAHLESHLEIDDQPIDLHQAIQEQTSIGSPVVGRYSQSLNIPPRGTRTLTATFSLRPGLSPEGEYAVHTAPLVERARTGKSPEPIGRFIVRRNLDYILGNCAVPVPPTKQAVCLLTDHVALPLGWMRDN